MAGRFLAGYVYAVSPSNPLAMTLAGVLLLLLTLAAAWLPAQRAGRTAPAPVLRQV